MGGADEENKMRNDVSRIARLLRRQFEFIPATPYRSFAEMFLQDNFALGYCFGFAQSAAVLKQDRQRPDSSKELLTAIFDQLLRDLSGAQSFVTYAFCQQQNITFQKGYDAANLDYEDWSDSSGDFVPLSLAVHLRRSASLRGKS